jgi:hypothetical protein
MRGKGPHVLLQSEMSTASEASGFRKMMRKLYGRRADPSLIHNGISHICV